MLRLISGKVRIVILLLIVCSILFSLLFRVFLNYNIRKYEERKSTVNIENNGLEQLDFDSDFAKSSMNETVEISFLLSTEAELTELENKSAELESSSLTLRERKKRISELWSSEMERIAGKISKSLPDEESRQEFITEQRNFLYTRRHTLMKEIVNVSAQDKSESIAYLNAYSKLTRERCYELLNIYSDKITE